MFIISQMVLQQTKLCNATNVPIYSIVVGLLIYACLYLYLMFYNNDYVYIFNKFVIYIIGVDLLLSAFVYMKNETSMNQKALMDVDNEDDEEKPENDIELESIYSSDNEEGNEHELEPETEDIDVDQEIESFSEQLKSTHINSEPPTVEQPKKRRGRPPKAQVIEENTDNN
jgi:hypothetical protein